MPLGAHADRWFDFKRTTAWVVDAAPAAASMTIRQPSRAALMQATVSGGTANTGTITFTGTVDGVAGATETLTFTGAGTQVTTKAFSSLSSVTTSGLADEAAIPTVKVKAVGRDGSPQNTTYTIAAGRCAVTWNPGSSFSGWTMAPGAAQTGSTSMHLDYEEAWQPREGDIAIDLVTAEEFMVNATKMLNGSLRGRLWEITMSRRQTTPSTV